jgi:hypothetical protein
MPSPCWPRWNVMKPLLHQDLMMPSPCSRTRMLRSHRCTKALQHHCHVNHIGVLWNHCCTTMSWNYSCKTLGARMFFFNELRIYHSSFQIGNLTLLLASLLKRIYDFPLILLPHLTFNISLSTIDKFFVKLPP